MRVWVVGVLAGVGCLVIGQAVFGQTLLAQITPDNTLGSEPSVVTPNATVKNLPASLIEGGARRGVNLFHSFREFNIGDFQRVYFANPAGIETILSRVTGADPSRILGTLGVNGTANLFFLNPNGIIFGPNARLDVAGSFVGSTASRFQFPDGSEFSATNPQAPPLLTINLTPGLQLGTSPAGATISNQGLLRTGEDLVLVGDRLELRGQLQAGGNLTLQASDTVQIRDSATEPFFVQARRDLLVQGNQSVDIFALNHTQSGLVSGGEMVLRSRSSSNSTIPSLIGDAHYFAGGNFRIETLDGSLGTLSSIHDPVIRSLGDVSFNAYQGASLHIWAAGKVEIPSFIQVTGSDLANGLIQTVTLSDGTSVPINGRIEPTLDIRAGVSALAIGNPGITGVGIFLPAPSLTAIPTNADIQLGNIVFLDESFTIPLAGRVLLTNQYQPNSALRGNIQVSDSLGGKILDIGSITQGGNVAIDSRGSITLDGVVDASARFASPGVVSGIGGNVRMLAARDLTLAPGSAIGSLGSLGGEMILTSGGAISITNNFISNSSYTTTSGSKGGNIKITANSLSMTNSVLQTSTLGQANAGDVIINVTDAVRIIGTGAINSGIQSNVESRAIADGGRVEIQAGSLTVNGAQIQTVVRRAQFDQNGSLVSVAGQGNAGSINLNIRDDITLGGINVGNGQVFLSQITSSLDFGARGNAGDITIQQAGSLTMADGALINSSTAGQGNAGNITINVQNAAAFTGAVGSETTGVRSNVETGAVGNGGDIKINAGSLSLTDGAQIQTLVRQPFVSSAGVLSAGQGNAGNVTIDVRGDVSISGFSNNSGNLLPSQIATVIDLAASGTGGNINLKARALSLSGGGQLNSATAGIAGVNGRSNAGSIQVDVADSLALTNGGQIRSDTFWQGDAGNISLKAGRAITLDGSLLLDGISKGSSGVFSAVNSVFQQFGIVAVGNGGAIAISADSVSVTNGATLSSSVFGQGNAGSITIETQGNITLSGVNPENGSISAIATVIAPTSIGKGGDITLIGNSLFVTDGGQINTATVGQAGANRRSDAGKIQVNVADSITVNNGAQLRTDTYGQGNAGTITLSAEGSISFDGIASVNGVLSISGAFSAVNSQQGEIGVGQGGDIRISANSLSLKNGAQINSSTIGIGDAGNISVTVANGIVLDNQSQIAAIVGAGGQGQGGDLDIQAQSLTLTNGAQIASLLARTQAGIAGGQGQGGTVRVTATSITLSGNSVFGFSSGILTLSERGASGTAGNIFVHVGDLHITDGALIVASTFNSGDGGNIVINADAFAATNGGQVVTNTRGSGRAGSIILNVSDSILLNGGDPNYSDRLTRINQYVEAFKALGGTDQSTDVIVNVGATSGLFANTAPGSNGNGGNIFIDPRTMIIRDGAGIFVDSQGTGIGGNIILQAGTLSLENRAIISAETASSQGGNITLNVQDILLLRHNSLISTTAGTAQAGGDGGNITINAPRGFVIGVLTENSDITANAFTGSGGRINITAQGVYGLQFQPKLTPRSDITASSSFGLSGTVNLNILGVDPTRSLATLPGVPLEPKTRLDDRCEPGGRFSRSSFVYAARDGFPTDPFDMLRDEESQLQDTDWIEIGK